MNLLHIADKKWNLEIFLPLARVEIINMMCFVSVLHLQFIVCLVHDLEVEMFIDWF